MVHLKKRVAAVALTACLATVGIMELGKPAVNAVNTGHGGGGGYHQCHKPCPSPSPS